MFVVVKFNMCMIEADMIERERAELETNFKSLNATIKEVKLLEESDGLVFENNAHTTVYLKKGSDFGEDCVNIVYWDGKKTSTPIVYVLSFSHLNCLKRR